MIKYTFKCAACKQKSIIYKDKIELDTRFSNGGEPYVVCPVCELRNYLNNRLWQTQNITKLKKG